MNKDEIRYVYDRLDQEHVRGLARQASAAWDGGAAAFELAYMPGDMTHYGVVFTILGAVPILGASGGGSDDRFPPQTGLNGVPFNRSYALVTYAQRGTSMIVHREEVVFPDAVYAGLTPNAASALALTVLLNAITRGDDVSWYEAMLDNAPEAETADVA